ncbi:MAG: division/cell wall cluster transcriptional repressor MraZ [Spirochaetales bacterium]|nr:division/cell wall cluster transcriptional repressor MraZ [Spirochaetales bacterium]
MLTGEYKNTIDEKGRIMIPSRIRNEIDGNVLVVTRGVEKCLWMFTPDEWAKISASIMGSTSLFKSKTRLLQRRIVAPAQECEIDKAGRVNIPPSLRSSAGLSKETIVLGVEKYIEIWDEQEYSSYLDSSEEDFIEAAEELDDILTNM